jgi:hypothetical protein
VREESWRTRILVFGVLGMVIETFVLFHCCCVGAPVLVFELESLNAACFGKLVGFGNFVCCVLPLVVSFRIWLFSLIGKWGRTHDERVYLYLVYLVWWLRLLFCFTVVLVRLCWCFEIEYSVIECSLLRALDTSYVVYCLLSSRSEPGCLLWKESEGGVVLVYGVLGMVIETFVLFHCCCVGTPVFGSQTWCCNGQSTLDWISSSYVPISFDTLSSRFSGVLQMKCLWKDGRGVAWNMKFRCLWALRCSAL